MKERIEVDLDFLDDNSANQEKSASEKLNICVKKCPYCAEEIQNEAIKCKHCKSNITPPPQQSSHVKSQPTQSNLSDTQNQTIETNQTEEDVSVVRWNKYAKKAKILVVIFFVFWLVGKGMGHSVEDALLTVYVFSWFVCFFYFFIVTGKQAKADTGSKWSYWTGILVIYFWGLGAYYGAKEFHKKGTIGWAGKILTVIGYPLFVLMFVSGLFYGWWEI